jgi:hypothetical protein
MMTIGIYILGIVVIFIVTPFLFVYGKEASAVTLGNFVVALRPFHTAHYTQSIVVNKFVSIKFISIVIVNKWTRININQKNYSFLKPQNILSENLTGDNLYFMRSINNATAFRIQEN